MRLDPFQSPATIAVFIVCLYLVVTFVISWCGWRQFARGFAADAKPIGPTFRGVTGWITPIGSYRRCLNLVVSSTGIYIETQILFRLFHQPLLFPWSCVSAVDTHSGILWHFTRVIIGAGRLKFRITLPAHATSALQRHVTLPLTRPNQAMQQTAR
jgi:hypothetical protein